MSIESTQNMLFSKSENNSVYYILKAIKLFLRSNNNNSSLDSLSPRELFSYSENDLEQVGRILSLSGLRHTAWYFLDYGAATVWTLQNRLGSSEPTTYRYVKDLRAFNFIVPAIKIRKRIGKKGGPRTKIWMVPDATIDHVTNAQKLHQRLMSPKYVAGEKLGQLILEEYIEPKSLEKITKKEVWGIAREHRIRGELSDIVDFAMNYLGEQGIKVWR